MLESPPIARLAAAIGDPVRAAILVALLDGRALTASELASVGGVTAQTASAHLSKLLDEQLLSVEKQGRHRYFRLAGHDVAELLEQLMGMAQRQVKSPHTGPRDPALRHARVCYDHIAGELGVALFDGLIQRGWLLEVDQSVSLTDAGRSGLLALGVDLQLPAKSRRPMCKVCLDWSMRKHHLSGALGQKLLHHCLNKKWAKRVPDSRVLTFSPRGEAAFRRELVQNN